MMNKKTLMLALLFLSLLGSFLSAPRVQAWSNVTWIYGSATSAPVQNSYGVGNMTYYEFSFSVSTANATWIPAYPYNITVDIPTTLILNFALSLGQQLNITGIQADAGDTLPKDHFLGIYIDVAKPSYIQTLQQIWDVVSQIGKLLVTFVVQIVSGLTGIQLPTWVVGLILVGMIAYFFISLGKKLPYIIMIVLFFVTVALVSNLMTGLHL